MRFTSSRLPRTDPLLHHLVGSPEPDGLDTEPEPDGGDAHRSSHLQSVCTPELCPGCPLPAPRRPLPKLRPVSTQLYRTLVQKQPLASLVVTTLAYFLTYSQEHTAHQEVGRVQEGLGSPGGDAGAKGEQAPTLHSHGQWLQRVLKRAAVGVN